MFYVPPEPCKHINPPPFSFYLSKQPIQHRDPMTVVLLLLIESHILTPLFSDVYVDTPIPLSRSPLCFPREEKPRDLSPFISMHVFPHNPNGHSSVITNYKHFYTAMKYPHTSTALRPLANLLGFFYFNFACQLFPKP